MEDFDRVNEELHELFGFGLNPTEFLVLANHDQEYCLLIIKELIRDARKGIKHKISIYDMLTGTPSISQSLIL